MEIDELGQQLTDARKRTKELEWASCHAPLQPETVMQAFEELNNAFEELQAVESELREQQQELEMARAVAEAERRRYQELFENAPDGYVLTDQHGVIREANRAVAAMLQRKPYYLAGIPLVRLIASGERQAFLGLLAQARTATTPMEWDTVLSPRNAPPVDVALRVVAVRDEPDGPVALRWLLRDITERKRVEAQIRALNEELEQRVAERTSQLVAANQSNLELLAREQAAREQAEAAMREREAFLAVAAHELKSPLTTVLGHSQLVQERGQRTGVFSVRDAQALTTIAGEIRRLSTQIEAMLDVGRVDTGQFSLVQTPVEIVTLVRRAAITVAHTLQKHTLETRLPDIPLVVQGDSIRLQQVLDNLIGNAIKYSPQGGTITLEVTQQGDQACIAITDQGIGIPEVARNQLFQRFYRAHQNAEQQISGLGIGLYVVKEILEAHGGTISVESEEGVGSTFTICLPLVEHAALHTTQELRARNHSA